MKTNKKRKGFTLIELIAVIAILGVLALIIVPRVAGYTKKATDTTKITNAKTIVNAAELYNADNPTNLIGSDTGEINDLAAVRAALVPKYLKVWPKTENLPDSVTTYEGLLEKIGYTTTH